MAWDFSTDPEFQAKLDWVRDFVREEVEPIELLWKRDAYVPLTPELRRIVDPLKQRVRDEGMWACHLSSELGGQGYGQLKLALMHEILGPYRWAWIVFGTQAPDTGNAEILAHYGTDDQKERYLRPLLDGEVFSCFSMTEPQGGSDPTLFTTRAERDGDEWVINGEKFFSSNARVASFLIVMAVTNPDVSPYRGMSMFLVPTGTPGINILDDFGTAEEPLGVGQHAHIRYENVRVPAEGLLGGEGQAFAIAQTRLGGGRVHHAMRVVGQARRAFDMMCERALSRYTKGSILAEKQAVQHYIASSYAEIEQFRLFVLYTAWKIDQVKGGYSNASTRKEIAVCKVLAAKVLHDVVSRAVQVHGALGISNHMPLGQLWIEVPWMGIMDGPTEVHEGTVAREVLKSYSPAEGTWPSEFLPPRIDAARARFAEALEHHVANL